MESTHTSQPHIAGIGQSLERSFQRHVGQSSAVRDAFAELAFEIALARKMDVAQPAVQPQPRQPVDSIVR